MPHTPLNSRRPHRNTRGAGHQPEANSSGSINSVTDHLYSDINVIAIADFTVSASAGRMSHEPQDDPRSSTRVTGWPSLDKTVATFRRVTFLSDYSGVCRTALRGQELVHNESIAPMRPGALQLASLLLWTAAHATDRAE